METTVRIKNQIQEISRASLTLNKMGLRFHMNREDLLDCVVSLEEILMNIVTHGYEDTDVHDVTIKMTLHENVLTMIFIDDGIPFNPLELKPPDLDQKLQERPIGGLGIHLVLNLMDQFEYERDGNYNRTVIKKTVKQR